MTGQRWIARGVDVRPPVPARISAEASGRPRRVPTPTEHGVVNTPRRRQAPEEMASDADLSEVLAGVGRTP
jgi:hypothetical protein